MKPITSLYQKDQKKELYKVWGLINLSAILCSGNRLTYSRKHVCVAGTKKVKVLTTGLLIARCNVLHWFVLFSIANKDHSSVVYFILFSSLPRLHRSELMKQKLLCHRYFSVSLEVHLQCMARKSRCSVSNSCYILFLFRPFLLIGFFSLRFLLILLLLLRSARLISILYVLFCSSVCSSTSMTEIDGHCSTISLCKKQTASSILS